MTRLDLTRRHDAGTLLGTTFRLFAGHWQLFSAVTALVVVPFVVLVDGLWAGYLIDGPDADAPLAALIASGLLEGFVIATMVTALHVVIVMAIARGERPTIGDAMESAADRLGAAIGAVVLATSIALAGTLALILPGIWLAIRLYFSAQAAVVDRAGPVEALRRSSQTVRGQWWQALGYLLLGWIVFGVIGAILDIAAGLADAGWLWLTLELPARVIGLSLTALWGTLVFFHLRAPKGGGAWNPPPPPMDAPERPPGV